MLPCNVRVTTVPFPKSIRTIGAGRTDCHAASKFWLMNEATSSRENNTVLARRAFVQQNLSFKFPISWNKRTGFPVRRAATHASAIVACQLTSPGRTFGLSD